MTISRRLKQVKVENKLNQAPFVKQVCQTLMKNNWTFRSFIDGRGGLENFLAATKGGYAHEISEAKWIKVSRVEEGTMWFHVSQFLVYVHSFVPMFRFCV